MRLRPFLMVSFSCKISLKEQLFHFSPYVPSVLQMANTNINFFAFCLDFPQISDRTVYTEVKPLFDFNFQLFQNCLCLVIG